MQYPIIVEIQKDKTMEKSMEAVVVWGCIVGNQVVLKAHQPGKLRPHFNHIMRAIGSLLQRMGCLENLHNLIFFPTYPLPV